MPCAMHSTHLLSFTLLAAKEATPFDSASANSAIPGFSTRVAIITYRSTKTRVCGQQHSGAGGGGGERQRSTASRGM